MTKTSGERNAFPGVFLSIGSQTTERASARSRFILFDFVVKRKENVEPLLQIYESTEPKAFNYPNKREGLTSVQKERNTEERRFHVPS